MKQAIERWLEVVELEDTTRERYDDLIRLYILPTFGPIQAAKLDAELLERFYARLHRCRQMCGGRPPRGHTCRPLSTSTTRKIHYIIRGAFDRAVRWQHLGINKAAMAIAPTPARTEPDPPSADEAARLLNDAWSDPEWGLLLWLTMLTGPRRGEVSALRWRHIDFERGVLSISRANAQPKSGLKEKGTKTHQARKIALDEHTVSLLTTHRKLFESRCAELVVPLSPDAFVFSPAVDGAEPYLPRAISQRYRRLALRLKLRSTRLHSLRHYSATELVAAGVDIRTVAGRLGHGSGGATTLKVYAAWVNEADRRAAATMATIVPKPVRTTVVFRGPYETIAEGLREQIRSGLLPPGTLLPTVAQLAVSNTVAVGTAHRALTILKSEGLIAVTRGKRAVVSYEAPSCDPGQD
ncbi:MAG: tyrosine-type recombinase/integrase [Actinomycetia bacterium]|nr:tyrosine-type recombinase/integrase [Actinomycetes bacterium]